MFRETIPAVALFYNGYENYSDSNVLEYLVKGINVFESLNIRTTWTKDYKVFETEEDSCLWQKTPL